MAKIYTVHHDGPESPDGALPVGRTCYVATPHPTLPLMPCATTSRTISCSSTHHDLLSNSNYNSSPSSETNCEYPVSSVTTFDNGRRNRSHHWVSRPSTSPAQTNRRLRGSNAGIKIAVLTISSTTVALATSDLSLPSRSSSTDTM